MVEIGGELRRNGAGRPDAPAKAVLFGVVGLSRHDPPA